MSSVQSNQSFRLTKTKTMISLSLIFFICFRTRSSAAFSDFTLNNRFLPNKNFKSFPVIDWLKCVQACQNSPSCISYNYDVYSDKSCLLNECGFRGRCEALENLVVSSGAIFHQLKKVRTHSARFSGGLKQIWCIQAT